MKCLLRHITAYPYSLRKEGNLVGLSYTCLVDGETAQKLEIESHAFRYIRNDEDQYMLVLIVRDGELEASQIDPVIHVPFNILRQFREQHPRVIVKRTVIEMASILLPQLPQATEVNFYFNEQFDTDQSLINALTASNFILRSGECYLDLSWLSEAIRSVSGIKSKLLLSEYLSAVEKGRHHSYLRCYMEVVRGQPGEHYIFKKGTTKVSIKQMAMHPYNIYRTVNMDKIEREIFELEPYRQLKFSLRTLSDNKIILLESEESIGTEEFLHRLSQFQLGINYHCIDCQDIASGQEFFRRLEWISNLEDSLVLVRNVQWLLELYQAEQILNMELKHIMAKIQDEFKNITNGTMRKYLLVIEYHSSQITTDMLQDAMCCSLKLQKPLKLYIFKSVFEHLEGEHRHREEVVQHCHDKFGWQKFKTFIEKDWPGVRDKSIGDVIKEISKLVKQEAAENLIQVSWDDVGGLESAKEEIVQTILLPIRHPQIFDEWIRPRTGLLFYGPPGTGKTLLGKCIAKECKMSFISVKGPELLNMYVGESEKNVKQVFQRAIACKPCIVFMDELDALIPKRGNNSDSHSVMDRIVAELLMQMDIASHNQVFVIGATNRPDLLDPSILRPGRFDKQIYLGITSTKEDRIKILKAQTRHLTLEQNLDWSELLEKLPVNFTGADFYGLTSKAVMAAAERAIAEYEEGTEHDKIEISQVDFLRAAEKVKPSVTEADLKRYDELKRIYS